MEQVRKGLTTPEQLEAMKRELAEATDPVKVARLRRKRSLKRVGDAFFILLILCLVFVLYQVISVKRAGKTPSLYGYYLFSIETESMSPTLPVGSVFMAHRPSEASTLKVGTIVTFKNLKGERVTHRIVQVNRDLDGNVSYRTKGDNPINSIDKDDLTPDRVEAVFVFKVPLF